jgi:hypothetical protein
MSKQTTLSLVVSLIGTVVLTIIILLVVIGGSMTVANTGGISAVAGGFSASVFVFLIAAFPILLIGLFIVFSRVIFKRR